MKQLNEIIAFANDILWSYILIAMLIGCAIWFTLNTRFVQFRMIGEMIRLLGDSTRKEDGQEQPFAGRYYPGNDGRLWQ